MSVAAKTTEAVHPAYGAAWIGGIVPAVLGDGDAEWLPAEARDAAGVVLLVLDGLGWQMVEEHRASLPVLASMSGGPITTVVPSTTAAGLTSIATGAPPAQHGLAGYRIRVGGDWLNVLQWSASTGPDPVATQPVTPFLGHQVAVVTRSEFRKTGFTEAHLRGVDLVGWKTTAVLVEHVTRLAADGRRFVYAYYDGVDKVAHEYGLRNGFVAAELQTADRLIEDLLDRLPRDWVVLVTADHGQVHVDATGAVSLEKVAGLVRGHGGEGRFRSLTARPGATKGLLTACEEAYGDIAWVFSRERLFDEGWLGPGATMTSRSRVGDVVLAARSDVIFVDPSLPQEAAMRSHHGSLTPAEMLVPLLAGRARQG